MDNFRFYHPIEVRYGDLDPQGHVNNARFLTYMEQARVAYYKHLGIWQGGSFMDFGAILAEVRVTFLAPIHWGDPLRVGMRVNRLGNKSITAEYRLENTLDRNEFANGTAVLVAYDYHQACTVPVPDAWRKKIIEFEGLDTQPASNDKSIGA
jgi:acyl-CoA thioester hydrolase